MKEAEVAADLYEHLVSQYGNVRVATEPRIEQSLRPDFLVYEEDEETPFLIVECKQSLSYGRGKEGLEQLNSMLAKAGCQYGALVTPSVEYVFRSSPFSSAQERSLGGFPAATGHHPEPRPIGSPKEAQFLLDRSLDLAASYVSGRDNTSVLKGVFQALLYKTVLTNNPLNGDEADEFAEALKTADERLRERYDAYQVTDPPGWEEIAITTLSVFNGYDLGDSAPELANVFAEFGSRGDAGFAEHKTTSDLVTPVLTLAEIDAEHSVLDPAAGWGVLARAASQKGAEVSAVEINQEVVNAGLLIAELTDNPINYLCTDFLETVDSITTATQPSLADYDAGSSLNPPIDSEWLADRTPFERIVVDPPVGETVPNTYISPVEETRGEVRIEEAFIASSVRLLAEDGVLVAIVPEYILSGTRPRRLRRFLLENVTIEAILTFESDIFSGAKAKGALLKIRNATPSTPQQIDVARVDPSEYSGIGEALHTEVTALLAGNAETMSVSPNRQQTLLPKQVLGERDVESKLITEYEQVTVLNEVAESIKSGMPRPDERVDSDDASAIRYLKPSDVVGRADRTPQFVHEEAARVVAQPTDLLLMTKGEEFAVHRPDSPVVPSSDWAVLRFVSEEAADAYTDYFQSDIAIQSLKANSRGTIVQYIPISALRELPVPKLGTQEESGGES
jgi:type I restriction enzyme M protein